MLLEKLPRPEVEDLLLEEVPDISYADIGGLDDQIEADRRRGRAAVPAPGPVRRAPLPAPKGILLYGPPGCGKTLIAKAVANSLAKKVADKTGERARAARTSSTSRVPELLNKYVGETERQIRLVFQRAREKSEEGWPVIVFFDEMDSMFRTRGSGISSDMESTIVPQLLAEIDGVEGLKQRHRHRRHEPRRPDRPGHPAARPARREDQDRAANAEAATPDLRPLPHRRDPDRRREIEDVADGDDRRARSRRCTATTTTTGSSRSRTRTATRRSSTTRTSRRAP